CIRLELGHRARSARGNDDRAHRLSRSEHDADDLAVCLCRGRDRGARQSGRSGRRRAGARCHDHAARALRRVRRARAEAPDRAPADPARAARAACRPVRARRGEARMRLKLTLELLGLVVLAALIAVMPRLVGDFTAYEFATVGTYFIALLGLAILTGYSGQISLGHGAFMAIGGYTTAILSVDGIYGHQLRDLWTIPLAGLIAGVAGLLVGLPALRLSGLYLALITFGIAVSLPELPKKFDKFFGGTTGKVLNLVH